MAKKPPINYTAPRHNSESMQTIHANTLAMMLIQRGRTPIQENILSFDNDTLNDELPPLIEPDSTMPGSNAELSPV